MACSPGAMRVALPEALLRRTGTIPDAGIVGPAAAHHAAKRRHCAASGHETSHHYAEPLRRPGNAGVEPARAAVLKRKAFVEQHHVVPLRALAFVHGEHIAVVELVIRFSLLPGDLLDATLEAIGSNGDFCHLEARLLVRRQ